MNLSCVVCGEKAPARHQWHNQEPGYGICRGCFEKQIVREGIEEAIKLYGAPGIHHSTELLPKMTDGEAAWENLKSTVDDFRTRGLIESSDKLKTVQRVRQAERQIDRGNDPAPPEWGPWA